jgi:hypothetical protein
MPESQVFVEKREGGYCRKNGKVFELSGQLQLLNKTIINFSKSKILISDQREEFYLPK